MNSKKLKKIFAWGLYFGAFIVVALIVSYNAFYGSTIREKRSMFVYSQDDYSSVVEDIKSAMTNPLKKRVFDIYSAHLNLDSRLKVGHYTLREGMSVVAIVRMLVLGEQTAINLTIGEARTLPQLAGKISKQIMADSAAIITAMYDRELRASLGYKRDSLIAMFVPNTYQVYWTISPQQLLKRMKRESDAFWNEGRKAQLKAIGMTEYQVMTLASIVYEETKNRGEMPKIAGVYVNRLRKRMPLQACPTVKYALGDFSLTRILHRHLKVNSPFNTYRNQGLPPAPICIPSIAADRKSVV